MSNVDDMFEDAWKSTVGEIFDFGYDDVEDEVEDPATEADPDSLEAQTTTERDEALRRNSGRASTILSGSSKLG